MGCVLARGALCGCRMQAGASPRRNRVVGSALRRVSTTVCGSGADRSAMLSNSAFLALLGEPGARARLKPEAETGLRGHRLTDGLTGQWIQPYWLWLTAHDAGGSLEVATDEGRVTLVVHMPG